VIKQVTNTEWDGPDLEVSGYFGAVEGWNRRGQLD